MEAAGVDLDALERAAKAATPRTDKYRMDRYAHGGGRAFNDGESGERELIADFYNEGDRELFDLLDRDTVLWLCAQARRAGELERERPSLLACFKAAKEVGLRAGDWSTETAIGEGGKDMVQACHSAATWHDVDSITPRQIDAAAASMEAP